MLAKLVSNASQWARAIKRDAYAVWLVARDPRTPWLAKAFALIVAGYAASPIDLIPDFVPVLGYLDDLLLVPLGILLVVRLVPPEVMEEHRKAAAIATEKPVSRLAAGAVITMWIVLAGLVARFVL